MTKLLITGTGRCGTTYCAEVLKCFGLNVTHQTIFTHEAALNSICKWPKGVDCESSFMAVPLLKKIRQAVPEVRILHVWRDRELVVDSWLKSGVFGAQFTEVYPAFAQVLDQIYGGEYNHKSSSPRQQADRFYNVWKLMADEEADSVMHIDDVNPALLIQEAGRYDLYADSDGHLTPEAYTAWNVSKTTNSHAEAGS